MNELRKLRRNADLSQRDFAELLDVPVNTFRMWDSGLRSTPMPIAKRAREVVASRAKERELLPLDRLARGLGERRPSPIFWKRIEEPFEGARQPQSPGDPRELNS